MLNDDHHYITINGQRQKTAAFARWQKRLQDSAFMRALKDQPQTPCEKGCKYLEKCKAEELACANFAEYVGPKVENKTVPEYAQVPSREMYLWVYSGGEARGPCPMVRLRHLKDRGI